MHDPARKKLFIELVTKAVAARPGFFKRPERDPARINGILDKLREVWERHPDLRLTQLVVNVAGATPPCPEIFYLDDDALLRGLYSYESQERNDQL